MSCITYGEALSDVPGWEVLCFDVIPVILGKMNLPDLARASPTCHMFQTACLNRATEDRAALIATAVEGYGENLVYGFVMAVRRTMLGLSPCPDFDYNRDALNGGNYNKILISSHGGARYAGSGEIKEAISSGEALSIIYPKALLCGLHVFQGTILSRRPSHFCMTNQDAKWTISKMENDNFKLEVWVHKEAATHALGLLLAVCSDSLEALPTPSRRLVTIEFIAWGWSRGAAGVREAADLVAPLRSLVLQDGLLCRGPKGAELPTWQFKGKGLVQSRLVVNRLGQ